MVLQLVLCSQTAETAEKCLLFFLFIFLKGKKRKITGEGQYFTFSSTRISDLYFST